MAENQDFTKKILVDVELRAEQVKRDIPILTSALKTYTDELKDLQASQKKLEDTNKTGSAAYAQNNKAIVDVSQSIRQLKTEVREANKYIDNVSKAIYAENNSISQNRAILSAVTNDYVKLGQAEGMTTAETEKMAEGINQLTNRLKEQEAKIGQTYRNVGNYTESINKSSIALQQGASGVNILTTAIDTARKGIGFMPQSLGTVTASLNKLQSPFTVINTAISGFNAGFKTSNQVIKDAKAAEDNLVKSKEVLLAATLAEEKAQEGYNAGTITSIGLKSAVIERTQAQTSANLAEATSIKLADVATNGFSNSLRVLKVVLASTGIGIIIAALATLGEYFTNTNDGAKEFEVWTTKIGARTDVLKGKLADLGRELFGVKKGFDDISDGTEKAFGTQSQTTLSKFSEKFAGVLKTMTGGDVYGKFFENNFKNIADQAKNASKMAEDLIRARQKLTIEEREYNNTTRILQQNELAVNRTRIRNLHYTTEERQAAAERAKQITKSVYEQDLKFAQESQRIIEGQQKLKKEAGVKVDKAAIAEAKGRIYTLQGNYQRELEMLDVRESRVDKMRDDQAKKEAEAFRDAEDIRRRSEANVLKNIYEAYGDRAIAFKEQHDDELSKLKGLYNKNLISQKEYNSVSGQLQKEYNSNIGKLISDYNEQDADRVRQSYNALKDLNIQNIKNDEDRTVASLKQKLSIEQQSLDEGNENRKKYIKALDFEIHKLSGKAKEEAEERRNSELELISIAEKKRNELIKKSEEDILKVRRKSAYDQAQAKNEADVLKAKRGKNIFNNDAAQVAEIKAITDKYNWDIAEAQRAGKATVLLEQQKIDAIAGINKQYQTQRLEVSIQAEQEIQGQVFDIISQAQSDASNAVLSRIAANKEAELSNTSLTNTQKKLIEQKYAEQEKQAKIKAFKENQKLQAANILINGAVAIVKTISEMGFVPAIPFVALTAAATAFSLAKVLNAKPGFEKGGQFKSDGRGALLSGYSRKDDTNATLRSGEAVVVSEAMRVPWARNHVSRINEMFGGRSFSVPSGPMPAFATGGIFTDGGNANRYYSQPVVDTGTLANTLAYQLINNFPPIYTQVRDVISEMGIVARTEDRVNL